MLNGFLLIFLEYVFMLFFNLLLSFPLESALSFRLPMIIFERITFFFFLKFSSMRNIKVTVNEANLLIKLSLTHFLKNCFYALLSVYIFFLEICFYCFIFELLFWNIQNIFFFPLKLFSLLWNINITVNETNLLIKRFSFAFSWSMFLCFFYVFP